AAPEIPTHALGEIVTGVGPLTADGVVLHVLVQHLVRVQLRAVTRKPDHPDSLLMLCEPEGDQLGAMQGMAIDDQVDTLLVLPDQTPKKAQEHRDREVLLEDHEGESALIG